MQTAPLVSTIHTLALIPVAFLFVYSFIGGIKKWRSHALIGTLAVLVDLSISVLYMLNRALGDKFSDSAASFTGWVLVYIIIHGIISSIVIAMELALITERLINFRKRPKTKFHSTLTKILFVTWCVAFISGELFYLYVYILQ